MHYMVFKPVLAHASCVFDIAGFCEILAISMFDCLKILDCKWRYEWQLFSSTVLTGWWGHNVYENIQQLTIYW